MATVTTTTTTRGELGGAVVHAWSFGFVKAWVSLKGTMKRVNVGVFMYSWKAEDRQRPRVWINESGMPALAADDAVPI